MEVEKLDNDNKIIHGTDDDAEFEIPDISLLEQYPDMMTDGTSTESGEAADEVTHKNVSVTVAADTNETADGEAADADGEGALSAEAVKNTANEAIEGSEHEATAQNEPEQISEPDEQDSAPQFETDENGMRVVPEGYIPDDALFTPASDPKEENGIIDLLGDPIGAAAAEEDTSDAEPITEEDEADADEADANEAEPEAVSTEERYDPEKPRRIDVIFDFVELLIFTLVAVLFITSFFFKHAIVDGPSMLGTLRHGDVLLVSDAFYEPKPGDIIVFEDYTLADATLRKPIVKRVIAIEGQRVMIKKDGIYVEDFRNAIDEPYVFTENDDYQYDIFNICDEISELDTFGRNSEGYWFVVPEGEIFVLGDHRNKSTDSRAFGTIREDAVLGKYLCHIFHSKKAGASQSR